MHDDWKKTCPEHLVAERYLVLGVVDLERTSPAEVIRRLEETVAWLRNAPTHHHSHPSTASQPDNRRITLASTERR